MAYNHIAFLSVTQMLLKHPGDVIFPCARSGIGTEDGSAEKDKDFRGKSQKQVQFNPGQTTATWKVRILPDNQYEVSETFRIVLSEPVMGALEFPDVATVEILDPGDGQWVFHFKGMKRISAYVLECRQTDPFSMPPFKLCHPAEKYVQFLSFFKILIF